MSCDFHLLTHDIKKWLRRTSHLLEVTVTFEIICLGGEIAGCSEIPLQIQVLTGRPDFKKK